MDQLYDFEGSLRSLIIEKSLFRRLGPFWKQTPKESIEKREYDSEGRIGKIEKKDCLEFYAYLKDNRIAAYYQFDLKDEQIQHHVYYYKETGELESREIFYRDEPVKVVTYEEDLVKKVIIEKEGDRIKGKQFDGEGRLNSEYTYHGNEADYIIRYFYDEKGFISKKEFQTSRGEVVKETIYRSNNSGLTTEEIEKDREGEVLYHKVFSYPSGDDRNWLVKEEYALNGKGNKIPLSIVYRSLNFYTTPHLVPLKKELPATSPERESVEEPQKSPIKFPPPPEKPLKRETTLAFKNGYYRGEVLGESMEGFGVFSFNDGGVYKGSFSQGVIEGEGEFQRVDGSLYRGTFKKGKMQGKGKLIWADGSRYEGPFKEGLMDGIGVFTWPDGTRFKGLFEQGKRTDQGLIEPPN